MAWPLRLLTGEPARVLGAVGTLVRYALTTVIPAPGGWPLTTLLVRLAGAFLLGLLLESLVRRGIDAGKLRILRLLVGTGFMGAFTTNSSLAVDVTMLLAVAASGAGIALADLL
ncbi:CrcB family protein [Arthrobacter terrae]|uniref:CrcB family protein n=1 Tax=Arthrobacter terrae TaxID=2935737 RepID=UPI0028A7B788|nr:CrcB family protein [Arthrobacter terrae]